MDKGIIESVVDKSIIKVKHNQFKSNINRVLREITDSKEEYLDLKKSVWHFWKLSHKSPVELMGIRDYNHKSYTSYGDEGSVPPKWEGILQGITDGLYYTGHNHPDFHTCFQSFNDFENLLIMNSKYSYTIGHDGFMIVKNTNNKTYSFDDLSYNVGDDYTGTKLLVDLKKQELEEDSKELSSYNTIYHQMFIDFNKKYESEIKKITEECKGYDTEFNVEYMDYTEYNKRVDKLLQKHISNNIHEYVNDLNNELKSNDVSTMSVMYCGKYERKKDNK